VTICGSQLFYPPLPTLLPSLSHPIHILPYNYFLEIYFKEIHLKISLSTTLHPLRWLSYKKKKKKVTSVCEDVEKLENL
jgi:hypothetical protein